MSSNGQLNQTELAPIAGGWLSRDAAAAWNAMNADARAEGLELRPTGSKSSYRTVAQQHDLYRTYLAGGNLAAKPGTSNHGWGLAVDVATPEMRHMIDRIGAPYGWAKAWSDAPSEWWHLKYAPGHYTGTDPGPAGALISTPDIPEATMALFVATMPDGRFEVFIEKQDGSVWHAWQAKEGGWAGAKAGVRAAQWHPLGTPGAKS